MPRAAREDPRRHTRHDSGESGGEGLALATRGVIALHDLVRALTVLAGALASQPL